LRLVRAVHWSSSRPSDARGGTNALFAQPSGRDRPAFGPASFEAHARARCRLAFDAPGRTHPDLGFDLDTPEDLEMLSPEDRDEPIEMGRTQSGLTELKGGRR